jgi:hypothetical protein
VYLDKLSPSLSQKLGLDGMEDSEVLMVNGYMGDIGNFDTSEVDEIIRQLEDGNAESLIEEQSGFEGNEAVGDLGAFGNPDITELQGTDALELNAVA